ncbi:hypothetical protein FHW16_005846 [Phyllobacterium myrsinacearum]|uniref:Uncharacterized protein n=1 Tax=Phyllobacterium myrsinacearum TaxID=28101 RepID=A0A839EVB5_9HYPH|nr:hypothetical protein [Phyllobacterium myrsinacearum]
MIPKPHKSFGDPERPVECEAAIQDHVSNLFNEAFGAGWGKQECLIVDRHKAGQSQNLLDMPKLKFWIWSPATFLTGTA